MSLRKMLCAGAMAGALTLVSVSPAFAAVWGTVTADGVNLRTEASTASNIAAVLNKDTKISVLGKNGAWFTLATENYGTAYIHGDYFKVTEADGVVAGDSVNVRSTAEIAENVLGKVNTDESLKVVGQTGNWYKVIYNGSEAYVSKDFVKGEMLEHFGETVAAVVDTASETESASQAVNFESGDVIGLVWASPGLNLRTQPNCTSGIVKLIPEGATIYVDEIDENGWAKVRCASGAEGYVAATYLKIDGMEPVETVILDTGYKAEEGEFDFNSEAGIEEGSLVDQIIAYAKKYIGTPYSWGGTDLNTGVDCSGFVYCVLKNFGISVTRTSKGMSVEGEHVDKGDLQPGDLVFFDSNGVNDGNVSHVGMYIGDGKYIHSSSGKAYGVTINGLSEDYSARTYVTARRVF